MTYDSFIPFWVFGIAAHFFLWMFFNSFFGLLRDHQTYSVKSMAFGALVLTMDVSFVVFFAYVFLSSVRVVTP